MPVNSVNETQASPNYERCGKPPAHALISKGYGMNDSTLLLPDSGPEFIRTLNLAVLYSESVHVFTFTSPQAAIALDSLLRELESAALQLFKKESGLKKGRALSYTNPSPNDRAATF